MESPTSPQKNHEEIKKSTKKRSSKIIAARRFSDQQIRSLESIFELETRLEPRKKLQLARDLGLQPRQVAIWFQNKRARWKSKQIEQEYKELRANYDCLYMRYENLKREKLSLQMQVQQLNDVVKNLDEVRHEDDNDDEGSKEYLNSPIGGLDHDDVMNTEIIVKQQQQLSWSEEEEDEEIITHLPERWCNLFDQSSGTSNWWED